MKKIKISELPQSNDVRGLFTIGTDIQNRSVKIPIGEVFNEEISKVKRTYGYSRIDALTVGSSADDVASALIAENESKRTMPNVGDILVDWGGVIRVPVVRQTVQTGGEKPIYSFSFRTADNTATKTVTIQGYLYEPQTVVSVETVKDVTQQQISTLDTQLAEEVTDRTNAVNAEATAREQADTALQTNIDALKATATADANGLMSKEDKATLDALPTQLTAEQTAREQADTAINGEIQGIKDKGTLHDLFLDSGATYNQDTKMYQLNGLDLTFNEMIVCYKYTQPLLFITDWNQVCNSTKIKTNVKRKTTVGVNTIVKMDTTFIYCTNLEILDFVHHQNNGSIKVSTIYRAFYNCIKLRKIANISLSFCKNTEYAFYQCFALKTIELFDLKVNISFNDSPLLSKESIVHLINHASPSSPITITLHPTAYAMATADPEIQAELEKQPNISLAEGEPTA